MKWRHWTAKVILAASSTVFLSSAPIARADDEPKPEQVKQMYQDTLSQLKSAQERKTQLAAENEQLKTKVADLEKQLEVKNAELAKQVSASGETFFLRSHFAAWQEFLRHYPRTQIKWRVFLENDLMTPRNNIPGLVEPDWQWSALS
jgi:hypothetical protein